MSNKSALIQRIREHAPPELLAWPVWLLWKGKKVPLYANGENRHGTMDTPEDRAQLVDFATAAAALRKNSDAAGLGVALGVIPGTEIVLSGIDFDAAYRDGALDRSAAEVLEVAKESYSERSISGVGFHILGLGEIGPTLKYKDPTGTHPGLEIYSGKRYFVMTGQRLNGSRVLTDIGAAARLARQLLGPEPRTQTSSSAEPLPSAHEEAAAILAALKKNGLYRRSDPGGKHHVRCPWEACHSADERGNRSTSQTEATYFEPGAVVTIGGKEQALQHGMFRCQHNACERRRLRDLKDFVGLNAQPPAPEITSVAFTVEEMLREVEPETFSLPGILTDAYSLIAGAASSFKTTFLIYLLLWKATGFDLLGLEDQERSLGIEIGKAMLLSYEDSDARLARKLRRIIQAGHAMIRGRSGEEAAKRFLDRIAINFRRRTHTGVVGQGLVCRNSQGGLIEPNCGVLDSLREELQEWAPEGVLIGLDPLRLAIVGSQNDDDGADVAVHVFNRLASIIPNSALVANSHTTKSGAADGVGDLTGATYATSGSALYSQHARGNFHMGRMKPDEITQLFPPKEVGPQAAAKSLVTKLTHGRNSYGEELGAIYFLMDRGCLRRVQPRAAAQNASDTVRQGLGPVVEAIDRLSAATPPVRPSRAALESDEQLRRHIPKQKTLRGLLQLLLDNDYLKDAGETSNRRLEVTDKARGLIRAMEEEL